MYKGRQTFTIWWEANSSPIEMKLKLQRCLGFGFRAQTVGSWGPCSSTPKDKGPKAMHQMQAMAGHGGAKKSCSIGNLHHTRKRYDQKASILRHRHRNDKTTSHWTGFSSGDVVKDGKHHRNELTKMKQMNKWAEAFGDDFKIFQGKVSVSPNA